MPTPDKGAAWGHGQLCHGRSAPLAPTNKPVNKFYAGEQLEQAP